MLMPSQFIVLEVVLGVLIVAYLFVRLYKQFINSRKMRLDSHSSPLEEIRKSSEPYKGSLIVISQTGEVLYASKTTGNLLDIEGEPDEKSLRAASLLKVSRNEPAIDIYTLLASYSHRVKEHQEFVVRGKLQREKDTINVKILMGKISKPTPLHIISILDISNEEEILLSREKDQLTGLPNQSKALHDVGIYMSQMHAENRHFALILTSLDSFTDIRAMLGYQKTDKLVNQIAEFLLDISKKLDSSLYQVARHTFLLKVPDIGTAKHVREVVQKIEERFKDLQDYSGTHMHLSFSTGVSIFPQSGTSVDLMMDSAYKALSGAEDQGGGYLVIDDDGKFSKGRSYESELYNQMHDALKNKEFELYYQPFVDMKTDKIVGAEALIRWNHPERGLVPPGLFIPIAEKSGLIIDIGKFVIEDAIKQQKKWEIFKFPKMQISINLTLREIEDANVVEYIEGMLQQHQVDPSSIKCEITENIAMVQKDVATREVEALKALGVKLSLDDFGTGYSSFGYLQDFSFDTIKIDQSFVMHMMRDTGQQTIVKAMIGIGHNFNLQVTAEGIEDKETYEKLQEFGCDIAQGYYFSKPVPVYEFQKLVRDQS